DVTLRINLGRVPRYLIRDRDLAFAAVHATAEAMAMTEVLTAPRSPWQNGIIERFIGSVWRECLDHIIVYNPGGLHRVLKQYIEDYEQRGRIWRWAKTHRARGPSQSRRLAESSRFR